MKRPNIEELEEKVNDLLIQATRERSHFYVGSVLNEVKELIEYIKYLEPRREWNWPSEVHEQYLVVLDERDALQEQVDVLEQIMKNWFKISQETLNVVVGQMRDREESNDST